MQTSGLPRDIQPDGKYNDMDAADIKIITELNSQLRDDLKEVIVLNGSAIRAKMEAEVDRVREMDAIRNGKIDANRDELCALRDQTAFWRWMHCNPWKSALIVLIAFAGMAYGYHRVDIKKTVENTTGVSLIDNRTDVVERVPR